MKKLLLSILIIASSFAANSQNLQNAVWFGTHPPSPNLYFKFWNDTLFYSTSGGAYTVMSKFTASGGQMNIFDIMVGSMCSDTGHYNYTINGTSLSFQVITDVCSSRRNTLVNYSWTLISTGINEQLPENFISIYPNPIQSGIVNLSLMEITSGDNKLFIYDATGKEVYTKNINDHNTTLDLSELQRGIYLLRLTNQLGTSSRKIIK
jgi:Secretion system C-terminal sorting domain